MNMRSPNPLATALVRALFPMIALVLLMFVGSTVSVFAMDCDPDETDTGKRLKCKHEKLLEMQEKVVGSIQTSFGEVLPVEDLDRLGRVNARAKKAAGRTDSKHFKQLAKKNAKICEIAELDDGKGNDDGICEPGEWCVEVIGDGIGNDKQPCKLHGNKKEVCVEVCGDPVPGAYAAQEEEEDEDYADMEDPIDPEASADWEEMYDDVTAQLEHVNELLEENGEAMAAMALGMTYSSTPADACKASIDWFKYGQILALTISKQITVGARGVADIAERGCDQTAAGFSLGGACIALEGIAAVTALVTETLDGILSIIEWGFQNGSESCMSVISADLQTAKADLATIKVVASGNAAASSILVAELGLHRGEFDTYNKDYGVHRNLMIDHDKDIRSNLDAVGNVLGDVRDEQDAAYNTGVEEALRHSECVPTVWLPAAQGGKLEYVRNHVVSLIQRAADSGDPTINVALAAKHAQKADDMIAKGQYLNACERLSQAVQALTK